MTCDDVSQQQTYQTEYANTQQRLTADTDHRASLNWPLKKNFTNKNVKFNFCNFPLEFFRSSALVLPSA